MRLSADKQSVVSQSRSSFCTNQAKVKVSWKRSGLADLLVSQHWHALSWVERRWEALSAIAEEEEEEGLAEHTDRISQFHRCFLTLGADGVHWDIHRSRNIGEGSLLPAVGTGIGR